MRQIGKRYRRRPVLRDVSIEVKRGEAVGLLGPNGAGKTTCFYIITGLITADYGEVLVDGASVTHLPMYRRARLGIGYLPQETSIFGLTVAENIMAVGSDRAGRRPTQYHVGRFAAEFSQPFARGAGDGAFRRRTAAG